MNINDNDLFLNTIKNHKGIIYKVANAYCMNSEDRKDLVQEIVIQLWRSFERYDPQFKLSTWIYRVALNVSISFFRKEKKRANIAQPIPDHVLLVEEEDLEEKSAELRVLQKFISELKELDRSLILLYLDEKSYADISAILGLSETNIATKISRIKNKLKQKFQHKTY